MEVFHFKVRIIRWRDADTLIVKPLIYRSEIYLVVRLKDKWEPEIGEDGHDIALDKAKELLGDTDDYVWCTNTHHVWTYERLECRVDVNYPGETA